MTESQLPQVIVASIERLVHERVGDDASDEQVLLARLGLLAQLRTGVAAAEDATIQQLADAHHTSWVTIANTAGRPYSSVWNKYASAGSTPESRRRVIADAQGRKTPSGLRGQRISAMLDAVGLYPKQVAVAIGADPNGDWFEVSSVDGKTYTRILDTRGLLTAANGAPGLTASQAAKSLRIPIEQIERIISANSGADWIRSVPREGRRPARTLIVDIDEFRKALELAHQVSP